jgi:hypothetical protein
LPTFKARVSRVIGPYKLFKTSNDIGEIKFFTGIHPIAMIKFRFSKKATKFETISHMI